MKLTYLALAVLGSLTFSQAVFADFSHLPKLSKLPPARIDKAYFQIGSVNVQEVSSNDFDIKKIQLDSPPVSIRNRNLEGNGDWLGSTVTSVGQFEVIVDKIVNIGKKMWAIAEAGRPVVHLDAQIATALPAGARSWVDLESWRTPVTKTFLITYKNLYGTEVVRYQYRIIYLVGGSVDGVGQYIGYATVENSVDVSWGFTVSSNVTIPTVYNAGTKSNPIGAMVVEVKTSVGSVLKQSIVTQSYAIDGRGDIRTLQ